MPLFLVNILTEKSVFDILCDILIHKRFSKLVLAIFTPFWDAKSPEDAKRKLKKEARITPTIYKALFRKGVLNNMPRGVRKIMLPLKKDTFFDEYMNTLEEEIRLENLQNERNVVAKKQIERKYS